MSDLVTGEAVVLELRLARVPSRCLAFLLDLLVQLAAFLVLFLFTTIATVDADQALRITLTLVIVVLTLVGYPVLLEGLTGGRTLGKMALGLRVVRDDGGPIRFRHALTRGLAGFFVDFWALGMAGAVATIVSLASAQGKRVGDYLAGTVVVRDRVPAAEFEGAALYMPPPLAQWAGQLDLSGLTDDLALSARQFLGRWHELNPDARAHLGEQLVTEVTERIGAQPPAGAPPWAVLTAVVVERRNRAHARYAPPPPVTLPGSEVARRPGDDPFAPPS
ncbi:RDD family protein [Amycolatopsis suaedae]|uniref:RDD family protein n=1 Tax=Amycolatopsis suaedae TaxID=2510978 RepID=A0A4Q7J655_9PSEU|nr:RDD family protein [Amycolatopsis suaedae]RZQ62609.1 RDD family protein [Amycolatopsis suaedae]